MRKKKKASPIDFGSYSDLFMVMSFVFLFMYVVSSINTGVTVIQERQRSQTERKKLETTVAKYERKLDTELNEEQKKEYDQLKAGILKMREDAKATREYQEKMAELAREKEKELDVYQESIKTMMIDSIKVSERIKQKEEIINKIKDEAASTIKTQDRAIASLKEEVDSKQKVLEERTAEIQNRTKEIQKIEKRVEELKHKEVLAASQAKELRELNQALVQKEKVLEEVKQTESVVRQEKEKLYKASIIQANRLSREKEIIAQNSQAEIERIQQEKQNLLKQSKGELEELRKSKEKEKAELAASTAAEMKNIKAQTESDKARFAAAKALEMENIKNQTEAEKAKFAATKEAELQKLKSEKEAELAGLKDKYQKATEGLRKEITVALGNKMRNSGLNVHVNPSTGDVTVLFKHAYYDYNSAVLKESMKEELKAFIPLYAKSLFENKKYAGAISSVEIIGSSSPSFKGKYVNPRALASVDERKAMTYNLDLSYRRAKSIFDFTFLTQDLAFDHKDEMIPLIKVTGTGYLQAMDDLVQLPADTQKKDKGFCGIYNCEVFQKVTLRFNLKDKVTQK
jgi:myosin heavy subunit